MYGGIFLRLGKKNPIHTSHYGNPQRTEIGQSPYRSTSVIIGIMKFLKITLTTGLVLIVLAGALMLIPSIRDRVVYHVGVWRIQIQYALYPPEKEVFVPQAEVNDAVKATMAALAAAQPTKTAQPTLQSTLQADPATPEPTRTRAPLPPNVDLKGVKYFDQHGYLNYCAPSNLAMELSFWGWSGDRTDVGKVIKPYDNDKNVMPYEMADYVKNYTHLSVVLRSGGSLDLIKALLVAGYPVLVEKGVYLDDLTGKISWMGHYTVVTGYDDETAQFITQDSFISPDYPVSYADFTSEWRAFNYVFLVIYPQEKESDLMAVLGDLADENVAFRRAAQIAADEANKTDGNDQFFAWYNRGTSLVDLADYQGAAEAYDQAFKLYADLAINKRPWRMIWYQTGPYFAYYYTGRYTDVKNLATQTIQAASEPYLEETFYWRAMAEAALSETDAAVKDLRTSLEYHPDFPPSVAELKNLGVTP
jgi:hypothetical protein